MSKTTFGSKTDEPVQFRKHLGNEQQDSSSMKRSRRQEFGIVTRLELGVICILFEDVPMWLFALTNLKYKHIYLPAVDSFTHLLERLEMYKVDLKLFNNLIQNIGQRKLSSVLRQMTKLYIWCQDC